MEFKDNAARIDYINKVLERDITPVLDKLAKDTGHVFIVLKETTAEAIMTMGYVCYLGLTQGQAVVRRRYELAGLDIPPLYREIPEDPDNKTEREKEEK